jgi:hypothetical protein
VGINLSGLALVGRQGITGINIGGLALVSEGSIEFLNLAGLAVVGLDGITGITVAGAGIVSKRDIVGLNITLGDLRNDKEGDEGSIKGISFGGYRVRARELVGINASILSTEAHNATGVMVGAYNRSTGTQAGISIGIFNHATELFGVQIGLVNYAENNPQFLRILPFLNLHF